MRKTVEISLTERQTKSLLVYVRMMHEHGAGPDVAKDMLAIRRKLERALRRADSRGHDG